MQHLSRLTRMLALRTLAVACLMVSTHTPAATAPYPNSRIITGMTWDFTTISRLRKAGGSDIWPLAWAADGNLYGAWGDGGGFDGDANNIGRVSLGFARIAGTPVAGEPASYSGKNVWGAAPVYAESRATFGGKVGDLISIDGVLYGQGGLWTAANCGCSNPTLKSGDNPTQRTVTWSSDLGRTWRIAPWVSPTDLGASLKYGPDNQGAADPDHVYLYYQKNINTDAAHIYLRRVLKRAMTVDPARPGHFEYLAGVDARGTPSWSTTASSATPVFFEPAMPAGVYAGVSVVYDAALGRYLLSAFHGNSTGQMGFFEGPAPWGPWATIAYYDDWGGFNESAGEGNGLSFPAKWLSTDGKAAWGVFSGVANGFDSFNAVRVVFTTNSSNPPPPAPADVGYWKFDEGTGTIANDSSGAGNAGRLVNSPAWTAGEMSNALEFTGGRDAVVVPASGSLANLYRHGLTVAAWVLSRTDATGSRIVDKVDDGSGWLLKMNRGSMQFTGQCGSASVIRYAGTPVTVNAWHHVAVTWDGSTLGANVHLYLDGAPADGSYLNGAGVPGDDSSVPLTIGNRAADLARGFDGLIDDVMVFGRVLSAEEIRKLQ